MVFKKNISTKEEIIHKLIILIMIKVIKSDALAFSLGLVIIVLTFIVSDVDAGSAAVSGAGLVLWIALWSFRWELTKK